MAALPKIWPSLPGILASAGSRRVRRRACGSSTGAGRVGLGLRRLLRASRLSAWTASGALAGSCNRTLVKFVWLQVNFSTNENHGLHNLAARFGHAIDGVHVHGSEALFHVLELVGGLQGVAGQLVHSAAQQGRRDPACALAVLRGVRPWPKQCRGGRCVGRLL